MDTLLQFLFRYILSVTIFAWVVCIIPQRSLIRLCHHVRQERGQIGHGVIKLSDKIAVKYGPLVSAGEAATQNYAYSHVNHRIVCVPRVYRYFQDKSDPLWPMVGYLFMEYTAGQSLRDLGVHDNGHISNRLAVVVTHLQEMKCTNGRPGPVGGDIPRGYLWGDDGAKTTFRSIRDLNLWLNKRLKLIGRTIDLSPYPLVFCHTDFSRRNVLLMKDDSICLLDWDSAGFFPRFYEMAEISCYNDSPAYRDGLMQAVSDAINPSVDEKDCIELLMRARAASLRYTFESDEDDDKSVDVFSLPPPPSLHTSAG